VKALAAPINIDVRAGLPSVAELELGVACDHGKRRVTDSDSNHAASPRGAAEDREVRRAFSGDHAGRRAAAVYQILISGLLSPRLSFAQDDEMPALWLDLGGEAEIIVPTDEFKSSAQFYEA